MTVYILPLKEHVDVYATTEPMEAYHARISFCLKMHNEAVRAMRYPPNVPKVHPIPTRHSSYGTTADPCLFKSSHHP